MESIYEKLELHQTKISKHTLNELFQDYNRTEKYCIQFEDIYFDYSKNFITQETLNLLFELAEEKNLKSKISAMFSGDKINFTENRAVLHTALRSFSKNPVFVDGIDITTEILKIREKMKLFVDKVIQGKWCGFTGEKITNIVNIGIGGSHLGPAMVTSALQHFNTTGIKIFYVSNIDSDDIYEVLQQLDLTKTVFIIASKTFTTLETMKNAITAKEWFQANLTDKKEAVSKHFIALSTNFEACKSFGIETGNVFEFWDWVGGRYSVWSSVGLSVALSIGWENFEEFLRGAYEIDRHFRTSPFEKNIPVIFGLISYWYATYWGFRSNAVIPYSHYLSMFPEFLQQLQMESNGKSVNSSGNKVKYRTGQVIWGEAGTNSQHSFFQLLHQGTDIIPVDFIGFINPINNFSDQHQWVLSNLIAQSEALLKGKSLNKVVSELEESGVTPEHIAKISPHKIFEGNRPSNILLIDKLTPKTLGKLIAIFEHKVFVEGIIWDINSFDQWGVELGKQLAKTIYSDLSNPEKTDGHDSSTNTAVNYIKSKSSFLKN